MATKSFLKDIVIRDKKNAEAFLNALETAVGKQNKKINCSVKIIKDKEIIIEMLGKKALG